MMGRAQMVSRTALHAGAASAVLSLAAVAADSAYPSRTVRVIIPAAAGGNLDVVTRTLIPRLAEGLGQQVIAENRPSASSLVGAQFVARSAPDGYTLLATSTTFLSAPAIVPEPGYDPVRDFAPISLAVRVPMVLEVNPNLPVRSVKELVALAKSRPGDLTYAAAGIGSTGHIAAEVFSRQAGIRMRGIQYKGNSQSIVDVIGGQVMLMFDQVSTSIGYIRTGRLRPLGVTASTRVAIFPDVPTIAEAGLRGYEDYTVTMFLAPAATPREVVARLHAEIVKAAAVPDLRRRFQEQGIELAASPSPEEFAAYVRSETGRYAQLAREVGIRAE